MGNAKYKGKPIGFMEFAEKYSTEEACRQKVFDVRWPDGFVCPKCGGQACCFVVRKNCYQCNKCKHRTTPKVGTIMQDSALPYKTWLWAIYLVATDKRGISAMELMRQLHVTYKTAWYLLHRIREAMGNRDEKYLLDGIIEFDDSYFGGSGGGGKRGRGTKKSKVLVAVSKDRQGKPKYLKMRVVPNLKGKTIGKFAKTAIAEGATIETDAYNSYRKPLSGKFNHNWEIFDSDKSMLVWIHTIVSNAKSFVQGTFHGLDEQHLQRYLNEFTYRFNRRFMMPNLFDHLLIATVQTPPLGLVALKG
jgi:transposase-like protein